MIKHEQSGLRQACVDADEEELLQAFEILLADCVSTSREQWVGLKESRLLLLGPSIANCIDHFISELRTPAISMIDKLLSELSTPRLPAHEKALRAV